MAVVQYSALVTQLRGKLGGSQFNKGHNVQTLQRKSTPTIRQTPVQIRKRQIMGIIQRTWKTETPERRAQAAAAAQSNPVYNRLGQQVVLPAYNHYVKMMFWRLNAGLGQTQQPISLPIQTAPSNHYSIQLDFLTPVELRPYDGYRYRFDAELSRIDTSPVAPQPQSVSAFMYFTHVNAQGYPVRGSRSVYVGRFAVNNNPLVWSGLRVESQYYFQVGQYIRVDIYVRNYRAGAETSMTTQIIQLQEWQPLNGLQA